MKSLLYEAQIVSEIAENMLAPKRCNYQEDYIGTSPHMQPTCWPTRNISSI